MHEVWGEYGPPVYVAVAAYLGLNRRKPAGETMDGEELLRFLGEFPTTREPS